MPKVGDNGGNGRKRGQRMPESELRAMPYEELLANMARFVRRGAGGRSGPTVWAGEFDKWLGDRLVRTRQNLAMLVGEFVWEVALLSQVHGCQKRLRPYFDELRRRTTIGTVGEDDIPF